MASRKEFLDLARKRFDQAQTAEHNQRQRELDDLRFYAGDQWPDDIKAIRQGQTLNSNLPPAPARPMVTINLCREPVRQILNQERQSDVGITLVPADDFGGLQPAIDHTEIELREGLIRGIQRHSEAQDARTWAFARAVEAGRGYYGVMTRYVAGKTFDQEVYVQRFYNQASVTLDPAHEQPDGSDADWAFVGHDMPWSQYKADHPKRNGKPNRIATCSNDDFRALGDELPGWFSGSDETRSVRVVDYYFTERTRRELAQLPDGQTVWVDELPEGTELPKGIETRWVIQQTVKWAKLDGCDDDVLDETEWPGKYIPIVKVLGEELQPYDKERRAEGLVRPARESNKSFNYMVSKWVEMVGLAPIPQWILAHGQDEGFEDEWDGINTRTLGRVHYNFKDADGNPVGLPGRITAQTDVAAVAGSIQLFKESVANVMSTPDTSLGHVDPTVKSGKLAKLLIDRGSMGTSNFMDNLARSMRHEARIVNDLLYPIYGIRPGRLARVMNGQGETSPVILHQPFVEQDGQPQALPQTPGQALPPNAKLYKLTEDADWNIAVKVSKNFDTRREQEAANLGEIIASDPQQLAIIGDLFFKYQDGPGHEEMADRYKAMLAPPVKAIADGKQGPDPQLQQAQQMIQQLQQALQSKVAEKQAEAQAQGQIDLQKQQLKGQQDLQLAQLEQQGKERLAWINQSAQIAIAGAKIDAEQARTFVDALEQGGAKTLDLHMKHLDHLQSTAQSQQDHQEALQQAALEHAHALEQGQQAAALTPAPTEGV